MSEDHPLRNVVALGRGALNVKLIEAIEDADWPQLKQDLLSSLEVIRELIEENKIGSVVMVGKGREGHGDFSLVSEGVWRDPLPLVGLMETRKSDLIDYVRFSTDEIDAEGEEE